MEKSFNLAELAKGALLERFNMELTKILQNIADPNTEPKKARKIQITLTLKPNERRNVASVSVQAKSTLVPTKPIETEIVIDRDNEGKVVASEFYGGIPGQVNIDDYEEDENPKIRSLK
jgi:hypothetical protein